MPPWDDGPGVDLIAQQSSQEAPPAPAAALSPVQRQQPVPAAAWPPAAEAAPSPAAPPATSAPPALSAALLAAATEGNGGNDAVYLTAEQLRSAKAAAHAMAKARLSNLYCRRLINKEQYAAAAKAATHGVYDRVKAGQLGLQQVLEAAAAAAAAAAAEAGGQQGQGTAAVVAAVGDGSGSSEGATAVGQLVDELLRAAGIPLG